MRSVISKEAPYRVIPDKKYRSSMYRLQWANGDLSEDMYNLTRASDILRNYDGYVEAMIHSKRMRGNTCSRGNLKLAS